MYNYFQSPEVPTFVVAGHETTSTAVTWALFALSQAPSVQRKLRHELRTAPASPTMDDINALPYLEKVTCEVLRLHAPIVSGIRSATEDTIIPVSKPYIDRYGKTRYEIKYVFSRFCMSSVMYVCRVSKGDLIPIPILSLQRSEEIWGPNADVFEYALCLSFIVYY
jgi:hypothetical protein